MTAVLPNAELDQQDREIERRQHRDDFVRRKPEYAAQFAARVGLKRVYSTSHLAVQYERGFNEWPNQPPGLPEGPRMQGYLDAELAHADGLAEARERRTSDFAELA